MTTKRISSFPSCGQLLLGLAALASGCRSVGPPGISLASSPPGARVIVDGRDSGFVTPCTLDLDGANFQEVHFVLEGYERKVRVLGADGSWWYVPWVDGDVGLGTWRFPLWLDAAVLFFPLERRSGPRPTRLYVHLDPASEP